jgi:hypothetical protein
MSLRAFGREISNIIKVQYAAAPLLTAEIRILHGITLYINPLLAPCFGDWLIHVY